MYNKVENKKVIVAGHICIDITLSFKTDREGRMEFGELFGPGRIIHVGRTPGIEGKWCAFCMVYGSLQNIPGAVSVCDRPRRVTNKSKCGMLKRSMISGELFL